ncbi:MAG: sigma-70 family RNA polymerase sigma factor [Phycisphaerales bacterium]|nr:sigma-70 family RNA polymerase sigma factor [Phycisphaerales bacterium]
MRAEDIFNILVRQHAEMLTAYIHSVAFDHSNVDDVFQETIITAWNRLDAFDRARPFGPWLRGIARNHILSSARGKRRYRAHIDALQQIRIDEQFDQVENSPGDSFSDRSAALLDCLEKLHPDSHAAVDLVYVRGLDSTAAARSVGASDETFRKRLYRARLTLAECLKMKSLFKPSDGVPA